MSRSVRDDHFTNDWLREETQRRAALRELGLLCPICGEKTDQPCQTDTEAAYCNEGGG